MKIIDCITFFDEELILKLRLNILYDYVDKFIITEGAFDHRGNKRKLNFDIKKFKKLVSLGWKIPNGEDDNFNLEVSIEDLLEGKVAKLIFETLKVFDLPDGKINCTYDLVFD